jgi:hypothetical protein
MKAFLALLVLLAATACGAASSDDDPQVGGLSIPLLTSSATHTYRLEGSVEIWQGGVRQQTISIGGLAAAITVTDLLPGNYDLFLNYGNSLIRDNGSAVPATQKFANPFPVTVAAGPPTPIVFSFEVAGDPVAFTCTATTCGSVSFELDVDEVPPS